MNEGNAIEKLNPKLGEILARLARARNNTRPSGGDLQEGETPMGMMPLEDVAERLDESERLAVDVSAQQFQKSFAAQGETARRW